MRWWPFKPRSILDADDEAWQMETWRWLLNHLGGIADLRLSPLVTPTRAFFPPSDAQGHARAERIFELVKHHARLDDWSCRLVAQPPRPETRVSEFVALRIESGEQPLGTIGVDGNEVVVTYDPASLKTPSRLIPTFAHELAHYLLATLSDGPPGGVENLEFATDLATVYLGFGLFGANDAFQFSQHQDAFSQGWSTSGAGYLREREWVHALAVFFARRDQAIAEAKPYLKSHLYSDLVRAARYIEANRSLVSSLGD